MQNWSLHSTKTGGSFQCNMKLPSSNMNGSKNDDEDDELLKDLVVDSKGGAKAETARLKLVQQNTAIFITYFTRFKAHDDSLKMEVGRMPETIRRVSKCLVDSFHSLPGPVVKPTSLCIPGEIGVTSPVNPNKSGIKVEVVRRLDLGGSSSRKGDNSVVWLQGNRVIHPISAYLAREESPPSSNMSTSYLNRVAAKDCLQFLFEGFIELIKCRETLKGIAMFSYFHFGKAQLEESPDSNPNKVSPFRSLLKSQQPSSSSSMSSRQVLMDFKSSLDRLATELEKYTEMLSDVVARRRLRASQYIIVNMSTLAREKRQECEDCLLVHTKPMLSVQHSATSKSSSSGLSRTNNKDSDSDNDILSAFENIFSNFLPITSKKSGGSSSVPSKPAAKSPTATATYTATATATSGNKSSSSSSSNSKPPITVGGASSSSSSSEDADLDRAIQLSLADSLPLDGAKTGGRALDDFDIALQRSLDSSSAMNSSTNSRAPNNTIGTKAPEQSVATLVAMGFDRAKAKEILARCDNDLDRALNALL